MIVLCTGTHMDTDTHTLRHTHTHSRSESTEETRKTERPCLGHQSNSDGKGKTEEVRQRQAEEKLCYRASATHWQLGVYAEAHTYH